MAAALFFPDAPAFSADGLLPWSAAEAPALALPSTTGEMVPLDRASPDTVIVHFFATWCEPCVEELTELYRLAASSESRSLKIIAVDVGEPPVRVRKFLEAHPVRFPVLLDEGRVALKAWGVDVLPTSFVLGPGLKPLWRAETPIQWSLPAIEQAIAAAPGADGRSHHKAQR